MFDSRVIGFFDMRKPVYLVRDLDFMRQITIKDFDNFEDHASFIEGTSDTLLGNGLFLLTGKKWRDMRATLSPAFTGSKMRHMFELVTECANDMTKYLINESEKGNPIRWEMKDLFSRYTLDVIASCAFGLKVDSLRDPTNEFFRNGTNCLKFNSFRAAIRLILVRTLPKLMKFFNFDIFPTRIKQFFKSMVLDTMNEREKKIIFRPDMINILMQVRHGALKHENGKTHDDDAGFATVEESNIGKIQVKQSWTDDEIVAQCFLFFAAGFDTASTLMSFLSYELAINPDIQRKLYDEICQVNKELNGGRLTYDILSKLKYLDQVISEGLRKWPPAIFNNRKCTKDFDFVLNGKKIFIERGRPIWIPTFSIHHDPKFFPDPKKFDPERFSDKNKHKIIPGSYIPFGMGPRNCIGEYKNRLFSCLKFRFRMILFEL